MKKGVLRNTFFHKIRCFPVNFVKFLRTPFFIEHLSWLLLKLYSAFVVRIIVEHVPGSTDAMEEKTTEKEFK